MLTLFTDLDNTMIYSKRRVTDTNNMTCVEYHNEKPLSYMLTSTISNLVNLSKKINIVPITTRVDYQFSRINLQKFKYVLINNGGILLKDGVVDELWLKESYELVLVAKEELCRLYEVLELDDTCDLLRMPDNMFVFAKTEDIDDIFNYILGIADLNKVHIFKQGKKLYIMPLGMDKGSAIRRFKKRFNCGNVYSAGDEILDFPMADESIKFITSNNSCSKPNCILSKSPIFSDEILDYINCLV